MRRFIYFIFLLGVVIPATVTAQNPSDANPQSLQVEGLAIHPFIITVDATPGVAIPESIQLSNTTDKPITFVASINDFIPNGTSGQPLFLGSGQDANPKYSLSRWISIVKQPEFVIAPFGTTEVKFVITPPSDAEPGTHYGGILFGRQAGQPGATGSAVQHKAGTIILVRIGKGQEQVELEQFTTPKNIYQSGSVDFTTVLSNLGNVHSAPKGEITLRNTFGKQITQLPINRDASIILPESKRAFISQWRPSWAFGRYTAEAVLYYGNPKLELRASKVIWVLPVKGIILGMLFLLILVIMIYIGIKSYNRYIINRSRNDI